jgi:apolipoprotein D and lipocalin family protein
MRPFRLLAAAALLSLAACGTVQRDTSAPITPVDRLEVDRYLGLWYEIARYPNWFEEGCVGVTAEYALRDDGQIRVTNTCRDAGDGSVSVAEGVARIEGPGRLSVTFTPWLPFARGDYWVLDLDEDYTVAVIGNPSGRTGWILARTPQISADARARAEAALVANGYRLEGLVSVPQARP